MISLNLSRFVKTTITALVLLGTSLSYAEDLTYHHPTFGFTLSYPDSFEVVPTQVQGVGLALRHRAFTPAPTNSAIATGGFPTLTVTVHPGKFLAESDISKQIEEVGASYRKIGLADVKVVESKKIETASGTGISTQLSYTVSGQSYTSLVTIIPGTTHHYILTYLDTSASFPTGEAERTKIVGSFKGGEIVVPDTKKPYPLRDQITMLVFSFLAFGAIGAMAWYQQKKRV